MICVERCLCLRAHAYSVTFGARLEDIKMDSNPNHPSLIVHDEGILKKNSAFLKMD